MFKKDLSKNRDLTLRLRWPFPKQLLCALPGVRAVGRTLALLVGVGSVMVVGVRPTQDAIAQGGTRSLTIYHSHTKEQETVTFKRSGSYDSAGLQKLNWLLRDWRRDEPTRMDPELFDMLWDVYRAAGSSAPIHVVSAYRSPGTNEMLRRRSRGVAKNSQHTTGKALDFNLPDVSVATVRDIGLRLQSGGVGYYPNANNPWIHLDTGGVRHWPKVSREHLVRLFPDEKTVHIPRDGKPLAGFEAARSIIEARGGSVSSGYIEIAEGRATGKSLFQILFGGGEEEEDNTPAARGKKGKAAVASRQRNQQVAALPADNAATEGSALAFYSQNSAASTSAPARAEAPAALGAIRPRGASRPAPLPDVKIPEVKTTEPEIKREELPQKIELAALATKVDSALIAKIAAADADAAKGRKVTIALPQRRPVDILTANLASAAPVSAAPVLVNIALPQPRPAILVASLQPALEGKVVDKAADKVNDALKLPELVRSAPTIPAGRPVIIALPQSRPSGLPSVVTAALRTAPSEPVALASSYAPAPPTPRIIPAAPSVSAAAPVNAAPERKNASSVTSQVPAANSPVRTQRVAPSSIAALAEVKTVTGRFEAASAGPRIAEKGFTGSIIRPLSTGFKHED